LQGRIRTNLLYQLVISPSQAPFSLPLTILHFQTSPKDDEFLYDNNDIMARTKKTPKRIGGPAKKINKGKAPLNGANAQPEASTSASASAPAPEKEPEKPKRPYRYKPGSEFT
jgi:hypothetical protein